MSSKRKSILAALCVLTLLAAIALWQGHHALQRWAVRGPNTFNPNGDAFWKFHFLKQTVGATQGVPFQTHDIHPTRGWTPKPNMRYGDPVHSTNDRGHRGTIPYAPQPEKYTVMVLGDSFTYGVGLPDDQVWPHLLQQLEPRLHVLNLAVGGYGMDQMYITLREEIANYKPQLVLFAPIGDDLYRSMLSIREYYKPRLLLGSDGKLLITNVPIPQFADAAQKIWTQYTPLRLRRLLAHENETFLASQRDGTYQRGWEQINTAIVKEAIEGSRKNNAGFLLFYLATSNEISNPQPQPAGDAEKLLEQATQEYGSTFVSTRPAFQNAGRTWTDQHYHLEESTLVAEQAAIAIRALPSFQHFTAGH